VYLHNPVTIVALEASAQGFVLLETQESSEVSVTKKVILAVTGLIVQKELHLIWADVHWDKYCSRPVNFDNQPSNSATG